MREASHLKRRWGPGEANVMRVDPLCHITRSAALAVLRLQLGAIVQCHYSWISSFPIHSKLSLSYRFYFYTALGSYRCISQHAQQSPGFLARFKVVEVPWRMWSLFRTVWKRCTPSLCSARHLAVWDKRTSCWSPFSPDKVTAATAAATKNGHYAGSPLKELPNPEKIH